MIGFKTGFLSWNFVNLFRQKWWRSLQLFLMPALIEELVFRVMLLPHPFEGLTWVSWSFWSVFSLSLFIIYHPLNALFFYAPGKPLFFQPLFLFFAGLLGLACMISYSLTGSLWPPVIIHWIVVVIWLFALGGQEKLSLKPS